jgi:SAM-dependent methyltransferase
VRETPGVSGGPPRPGGALLVEELERHEQVWESRPLLRLVYRDWHRLIVARLSAVPGASVELGAGIGRFAREAPSVRATDVEPTPWAEEVADAEELPYGDGSLANLVLVDVFHHVARPARFLDEACRTLAPGGRAIVLDPYCSPLSTLAYRRFHHETTDLSADALAADPAVALAPMESNQARATLVFFRERARFERTWPELRIAERRLLSLFLYPLTGGFSRRPLLPAAAFRPLRAAERVLEPALGRLAAFRCLVVLERS